jgi:gamma-glutamylcyclotransferase (GGCT)/AIG2-like uncharacterized protein YtfP
MADFLFVYGTLRKISRHPMAGYLAGHATFVGAGTVAGRLYNLGRYPGLTAALSPSDRVHGDVYRLDEGEETIQELDRYENTESPLPSFFERGKGDITLADGKIIEAMVYWFRGTVTESQVIASGDYREVLES